LKAVNSHVTDSITDENWTLRRTGSFSEPCDYKAIYPFPIFPLVQAISTYTGQHNFTVLFCQNTWSSRRTITLSSRHALYSLFLLSFDSGVSQYFAIGNGGNIIPFLNCNLYVFLVRPSVGSFKGVYRPWKAVWLDADGPPTFRWEGSSKNSTRSSWQLQGYQLSIYCPIGQNRGSSNKIKECYCQHFPVVPYSTCLYNWYVCVIYYGGHITDGL
jgi:hypothetical protein